MQQNVCDVVNDCAYVLTFLSDVFGSLPAPDCIVLNYEAQTGLSLILNQAARSLFASGNALSGGDLTMEVPS